MKRLIIGVLMAAMLGFQPVFAEQLLIPKDTRVPFVFKSTASALQFKKGDKVLIETVEDVNVGNILVFPKGSQGVAIIYSRIRPNMIGIPGGLDIRQAFIKDTSGIEYELKTKYAASGSKSSFPSALIGSSFVFPVLAPFAILAAFRKGKDVSIPEGVVLDGFTTSDTTITLSQTPAVTETPTVDPLPIVVAPEEPTMATPELDKPVVVEGQ